MEYRSPAAGYNLLASRLMIMMMMMMISGDKLHSSSSNPRRLPTDVDKRPTIFRNYGRPTEPCNSVVSKQCTPN